MKFFIFAWSFKGGLMDTNDLIVGLLAGGSYDSHDVFIIGR